MQWVDIKRKYPDKFILIDDIVEKDINGSTSRVISGIVIAVTDNLKEIMKLYDHSKKLGKNVLYALPSTPDEFLIENVPFMGILFNRNRH